MCLETMVFRRQLTGVVMLHNLSLQSSKVLLSASLRFIYCRKFVVLYTCTALAQLAKPVLSLPKAYARSNSRQINLSII